jgi:hypothetical protein
VVASPPRRDEVGGTDRAEGVRFPSEALALPAGALGETLLASRRANSKLNDRRDRVTPMSNPTKIVLGTIAVSALLSLALIAQLVLA